MSNHVPDRLGAQQISAYEYTTSNTNTSPYASQFVLQTPLPRSALDTGLYSNPHLAPRQALAIDQGQPLIDGWIIEILSQNSQAFWTVRFLELENIVDVRVRAIERRRRSFENIDLAEQTRNNKGRDGEVVPYPDTILDPELRRIVLAQASQPDQEARFGKVSYFGPIGNKRTLHQRLRPVHKIMSDPFEVRVRFTNHLANLNASVTSATKTAQYALKYKDMDEDLHSCIIEQLERDNNTLNNRANIMYFLETLCDLSYPTHAAYINMMRRDILRIVEAVAPEDGSGAANVKVVRKVLHALGAKQFIEIQTVTEIDEILNERSQSHINGSAIGGDWEVDEGEGDILANGKRNAKLEKKQVEQRIEEDRERHKRGRENIWAVKKGSSEAQELWDDTSSLGDDDYELYAEEAAERAAKAKQWAEECGAVINGNGDTSIAGA